MVTLFTRKGAQREPGGRAAGFFEGDGGVRRKKSRIKLLTSSDPSGRVVTDLAHMETWAHANGQRPADPPGGGLRVSGRLRGSLKTK